MPGNCFWLKFSNEEPLLACKSGTVFFENNWDVLIRQFPGIYMQFAIFLSFLSILLLYFVLLIKQSV